jgi:hypothetical protein
MHPKKNIFAVRNRLTSRLLIWSCVTNLLFCSIGFAQSQDTPRRSPLNEPVIATATRKLCVSTNGKIARKGTCARAEVEIANNKIQNKKIAVRKAQAGTSVLSSPAVTLSSSGTTSVTTKAANSATSLISTVGQSVRAYTYALSFDKTWTGQITTGCSEYEVPITTTAVAFQGNKKLPTGVDQPTAVGEAFFSGLLLGYLDSDGNNTYWPPAFEKINATNTGRIFDASTIPGPGIRVVYDIPSDIILYVTQVCAPLSQLDAQ